MTIRRITCFALVLWLAPVAARADADQDVLASAKTLYESAAYEAALSELGGIEDPKHADAVSTYQALCLLGLGRTRDAERALETLVVRQPLLKLSDADYSPRVVALFRDVRQRALPQAAQQLYATAKTEYDNKNYEAAAARFQDVLHLIDDVDAKQQTATLADIKQLADGFLTLANGKVVRQAAPVAAPVAAPAPPPAQPLAATRTPAPATKAPAPTTKAPAATTTMTQAAPTTAPPAATAAPGANTSPANAPPAITAPAAVSPTAATAIKAAPVALYTLLDVDVTPPVATAQRLPPWRFHSGVGERTLTGQLELVIDEKGVVESVQLAEPIWPAYDALLIRAARSWRYQPATKDGKPVKFRRVLDISVDPTLRPGR
jgi:tetratricopeptide (TPR) repeat protein